MICKFRMGERDLEKVANFFRSLSFFYVGKKKNTVANYSKKVLNHSPAPLYTSVFIFFALLINHDVF